MCGRDAGHFGPVGGFLIARITHNHSVLVEAVEVTLLSFVSGHLQSGRCLPLLAARACLLAKRPS
jgi:hypothetical protein